MGKVWVIGSFEHLVNGRKHWRYYFTFPDALGENYRLQLTHTVEKYIEFTWPAHNENQILNYFIKNERIGEQELHSDDTIMKIASNMELCAGIGEWDRSFAAHCLDLLMIAAKRSEHHLMITKINHSRLMSPLWGQSDSKNSWATQDLATKVIE